jgi:hypothetical protein
MIEFNRLRMQTQILPDTNRWVSFMSPADLLYLVKITSYNLCRVYDEMRATQQSWYGDADNK